ncbi:MAG: hypothetical protein AAFU65_02860, partial [Pseudomonadota bacterium]
ARFKRAPANGPAAWASPPTLRGSLYDPARAEPVAVALVPMGSTILRKVAFDVVADGEETP